MSFRAKDGSKHWFPIQSEDQSNENYYNYATCPYFDVKQGNDNYYFEHQLLLRNVFPYSADMWHGCLDILTKWANTSHRDQQFQWHKISQRHVTARKTLKMTHTKRRQKD